MPQRHCLILLPLLLFAGSAAVADCEHGRSLYEAAQLETDAERRIALLRESTDVCPDPVAFGDLAMAYLGAGDAEAALDALGAAAATSSDPDQLVQLYALTASIHQQQGRLPEAISAIGVAFDQAGAPAPDWVLDVRRAIDTDPDRGRLSAGQITRSLSSRSFGTRGFQAVPKLDLYILFDYDKAEKGDAHEIISGKGGRP